MNSKPVDISPNVLFDKPHLFSKTFCISYEISLAVLPCTHAPMKQFRRLYVRLILMYWLTAIYVVKLFHVSITAHYPYKHAVHDASF